MKIYCVAAVIVMTLLTPLSVVSVANNVRVPGVLNEKLMSVVPLVTVREKEALVRLSKTVTKLS